MRLVEAHGVLGDVKTLDPHVGMPDTPTFHRDGAERLEGHATAHGLGVFRVDPRRDETGIASLGGIRARLNCREVAGAIALDRMVRGAHDVWTESENA